MGGGIGADGPESWQLTAVGGLAIGVGVSVREERWQNPGQRPSLMAWQGLTAAHRNDCLSQAATAGKAVTIPLLPVLCTIRGPTKMQSTITRSDIASKRPEYISSVTVKRLSKRCSTPLHLHASACAATIDHHDRLVGFYGCGQQDGDEEDENYD